MVIEPREEFTLSLPKEPTCPEFIEGAEGSEAIVEGLFN